MAHVVFVVMVFQTLQYKGCVPLLKIVEVLSYCDTNKIYMTSVSPV